MSNILIGLYGSKSFKGGAYNMLSSFTAGLYDALEKSDYEVKFMTEITASGLTPNLTIAFNTSGAETWQPNISAGIPHVIWCVDSPFMQLPTIQRFMNYKHFIFAGVSPVDKGAMSQYFPEIPYIYLPHGVDPSLWFDDDSEKVHDLVFMSSVQDYNVDIENLKQQLSPEMFKMFMEMFDYALRNPEIAYWELYKQFSDAYEFPLNELSLYYVFFLTLCYSVTYQRRIDLVKSLKDMNLKVWGSPLWEKYVEGNTQYMGSADLMEATKIIRQSKVVLHLQPMQTLYGFHERVINAMASNAFVISDYNPQLKLNFDENIGFFYNNEIDKLKELVSYYLKNDQERIEKANRAKQMTLANHTWENRSQILLKALLGN